jgi:hypothetical protein
MTQVMNLLNLASDLQASILFLPARIQGRETIAERNLRPLTRIVSWERQRKAWRDIVGTESNSSNRPDRG